MAHFAKRFIVLLSSTLVFTVLCSPYVPCAKQTTDSSQGRRLYISTFNARGKHLLEDTSFKLFVHGLGLPHDHVEVLGAGIEWEPDHFLNKPKAYLGFIRRVISDLELNNHVVSDAYVLLLDYDTFINTASLDAVWGRYDCARSGKSILISAESRCWMGHSCTEKQISAYFQNLLESTFPFLNSGALMGPLRDVKSMLTHITENNKYYLENQDPSLKHFSDQSAVTIWADGHKDLVAVDVHQQMFATTSLYLPVSNESRSHENSAHAVCVQTQSPQRNIVHNCRDQSNAMKDLNIYSIHETECSLIRNTSNLKGSAYHVMTEASPEVPIIWHGSGGGKTVFNHFKFGVEKCLLRKYAVT